MTPHTNGLQPTMLGRLLYNIWPLRKGTVLDNMRQAFGDSLSETDIHRLARCYYSHLGKSILENLSTKLYSDRELMKRIRIEGAEHLREASKLNRGILVLSGHFGNFEFAPIAAIHHVPQYKGRFHFIRKTMVVKWIEKLAFWRFYRSGLGVIPKAGSMQQVFQKLENNDVVVFIMDQHAAIHSRKGMPVEFFGKKAATNRSLALIAGSTGAPVIPTTSYREPDGSHVMKFCPPVPWIKCADSDEEIYRNTKQYNEILEGFIREHPDQWLWLHRRWKIDD